MATSNTRTKQSTVTPDVDEASEQIRQAGDRFVAAGRKMTVLYLDGVERYVASVTKTERKIGEQARVGMFGQVLTAHADLSENMVKAGIAATRELVSA
jgi:hypothetical protein